MTPREKLLTALGTSQPVRALRTAVEELLAAGLERADVLSALDALRLEMRRQGDEGREDALADVMDFVVGWCSPDMYIQTPKPGQV
jgi:hypothetical protein